MRTTKPAARSVQVEYEDVGADSLLTALTQQIGGIYRDGILQVPPSIGRGNVGFFNMEDGLYLRYFYFTLDTGLGFRTKAPKVDDRFFHLYYLLNTIPVKTALAPRFKITANTLFIPNNLEIQGHLKAGSTIKAISILFTPEWLERNKIVLDDHVRNLFHRMQKNGNSSLLLNHMSLFDYSVANTIHKFLTTGESISLQTRLNCLLLVNRFFADLAARKRLKTTKWRSTPLAVQSN